ncbi:MAG: BlaI/MecI/CopY family transcriptional regulator [Acidimicrobiales bacterium]
MSTMNERRPIGSLEAEVLERLWAHPDGAAPRKILDELGVELAYTTITTILTRLSAKGLAERERHGRGYIYRPTVSEADLTARKMGAALDRTHDRQATLAGFVKKLSTKDERLLRALLERPGR